MKTFAELMNLKGRVAVVTGGAGHLGKAAADTLAELGANVVILDMNQEACVSAANDLAKTYQVKALPLVVDLSKEAEVRAVPAQVEKVFGRLDILLNCAALVGTSALKGWGVPFEQQVTDTWRLALEVNLTAIFELVQAGTPLLRASGHGSIINISSIYGVVGPNMALYEGTSMGNPAAYAASKGGIIQLSRWMSTVLAPDIRANTITPGGIYRNQAESFHQAYVSRTPLKRMGTEEDFKGAVGYLASDLSAYVTGQNLIVDGGWTVW